MQIEKVKQLLWSVSEVLPLDLKVLRTAAEYQADYNLSAQDAIVYASIRARLEIDRAPGSCFVSRNAGDFDNADLRRDLASLNCKYFSSFVIALQYIEHAIASPPAP
jgi:predicted nucleic acid-binding protein